MQGRASTPAPPDDDLVARARGGDRGAFEALLLRHQDRVYQMSCRLLGDREDALDIAQEIFLTIHRALPRFQERASFGTWLYRVTLNRCRDELRRRKTVKHTQPASLDSPRDPASPLRGPHAGAEAHEAEELVTRALKGLPDDAREICVLRDIEGLSYEEIAEALEIPVGTVRSRLNRARALLREALRPVFPEEK